MATETADAAGSSATNVLLSPVTPGLTRLMSEQLSDSVIIQILRLLQLPDVLALRATSKFFADLASRMFVQLFPARRICLNERLLRAPGRWEIGGREHRTLDGLRKLYGGGAVKVDIVARATKADSKDSTDSSQVEGFPTYWQTRVLTDHARGFLSPDDEVKIHLKPRVYTRDHVHFDLLAQFRAYITDFSVQSGAPLWIWMIGFLRKTTLTEKLTRLYLGGVLLPVQDDSHGSGSSRSGKSKKDATKEIGLMLRGLPGLEELSLEGTRLEIGKFKQSLLRMTSMVSLGLGRTRTDPEDAADVVSCMPNLSFLDLSGIRSVPERLAHAVFSRPLRILGLGQCGITDVRVLTSAALRAPQSTIHTLDLSWNWNALDPAGDIAALVDALPALREINLQETLRNLDQLVDVFVSRPSVKAYLSFPLAGRLANHDTRNAMKFPDNIVFYPLNHGP
jgi:hypothetical protein